MRITLFCLPLLLIACDIQNDVPEFAHTQSQADKDAPYPDLVVTQDLVAAGTLPRDKQTQRETSNAQLLARAEALRARAARLRRQTQN